MLRGGFFNSQNHDRMYNATDFNELISTIKSDGIDNYGDKLEVSAGQDLSVLVSTGKCFFNNHWLYNDSAYQIELEEASIVADRIDAIVVEVNEVEREVFLKSVSGEPSNTPVPPTLVDSGSIHQHLLAYVDVPKEATSVSSITDKRSEWADVKSFKLDDVQEQITENIENGTTASRTYNAGEYIVRGGVYYRVKTTIASGTSFVVGTNIEKKSVGEEITAINNNLSQNSIGSPISLNSITEPYLCQSDGYISLQSYGYSARTQVSIIHDNKALPFSVVASQNEYKEYNTFFVKKGMYIRKDAGGDGTYSNISFIPLS